MTSFLHSRFYLLLTLLAVFLLAGCSSSESEEEVVDSFTVSLSTTEISVAAGNIVTINFSYDKTSDFLVTAELTAGPTGATVNVNNNTQSLIFTAGNVSSSGIFTVTFSSENQSISQDINYQVTSDDDDNTDTDCEVTEDCDTAAINPNILSFPTDYITIFEDESVEISLHRNYEMADDIEEAVYFNSHNIVGRVSEDKQSIILEATIGDEDTYGEIIAVTKQNGVENRRRMYLVYYNKNRDLTSSNTPVVALLDNQITYTPGQSSDFDFELYDSDSDRIAYRITNAPAWLDTHLHTTSDGMRMSLYPKSTFDSNDNVISLQLSDGFNTSTFEFEVQAPSADVDYENTRPTMTIEPNVDLSLIKRLQGDETDLIATFAFAVTDAEEDRLDYDVLFSNSGYTFREAFPYIYVYSDDVSQLQHDQVTVVANDGSYQSKLTFHLYKKDNFLEFQGGSPNVAPVISSDTALTILETKTDRLAFSVVDMEAHEFNTGLTFSDSQIQAVIDNGEVVITALPITGDEDINAELTIWSEDSFGARREQIVTVTVEKNTPPDITIDTERLDLVEGFDVSFNLTVDDINEGILEPSFGFDESKVRIVNIDGVVTVTALNIVEDYEGIITISATDEFNATTTIELPVSIAFTNSAPIVTASETFINLLPGFSTDVSLSFADPEEDTVTYTLLVDDDNLNFLYDPDAESLTLSVENTTPYETILNFIITATDGFLTTTETITVRVPEEPRAPELTIQPYLPTVNEGGRVIINFETYDFNSDNVTVEILGDGLGDLTITEFDNAIQLDVPDNVLTTETYSFNLQATDDSIFAFTDIEFITFDVLPVNDPPIVELSASVLVLTNDDIVNFPMTVTDIDDSTHVVEIRSLTDVLPPDDIVIHAADVDTIQISGATKGTEVTNAPVVVRVYDNETYTDELLLVTVVLENEPPTFEEPGQEQIDLIQMLENSTLTFPISVFDPDNATDGDVVTITSVSSSDEGILTIVGDPDNPSQIDVTVTTGEVTENTELVVTLFATDGFDSVSKSVIINVQDVP